MRVVERAVWVGLAGHGEANLPRLDECNLEIRDWTRDGTRRVCFIRLARISHNEPGVAVGLCLQPDQLVAVPQPLRRAGTRIVCDQGGSTGREIQNADLIGLGVGLEGVGSLGVDRKRA